MRRNKKKKDPLKIAIIVVSILLAIVLAVGASGYAYINGKFSLLDFVFITKDHKELGISETTEAQMAKFRNIALLGIDSLTTTDGYDYDEQYRSDCIMIASIREDTNEVNLYSVYRDTFVQMELDGQTKLDKINHAYYGGVANTIKTLNNNFDLNIKEFVMVDFKSLSEIIDAVGGVSINVDSSELKYINSYVSSINKVIYGDNKSKYSKAVERTGTQNLNGVQAVAYCRIRYTEGGDYKRTERMRDVLGKVIEKVKNKNIFEIDNLLEIILPKIRTNIERDDVFNIVKNIFSYKIISNFGFPYEKEEVIMNYKDYSKKYDSSNKDWYTAPKTLESNVLRLHKEIYGQENYVVPDNIKAISEEIIKTTKVGK